MERDPLGKRMAVVSGVVALMFFGLKWLGISNPSEALTFTVGAFTASGFIAGIACYDLGVEGNFYADSRQHVCSKCGRREH